MDRVIRLPERGQLFVATDFQGNLRDFERMAAIFEEAAGDDAVLVVTGDLVHGPEIGERHWPDYLGSFFSDDSVGVLARAEALAARYPGRVFYLLGNHEHAHIGGPVVSKFFPDEAMRLEELLGPRRALAVRRWLATWPLVAVARQAGILMLHGAPNASIDSPGDIDEVELSAAPRPFGAARVDALLAEILWARTTTTERARAFLNAVDEGLRVAVYGHDVARGGFAIDREPLLCISTSFGCYDGDKRYLRWDLAEPAASAADLAARGLCLLWPDEKPVHRSALPPSRNTSRETCETG